MAVGPTVVTHEWLSNKESRERVIAPKPEIGIGTQAISPLYVSPSSSHQGKTLVGGTPRPNEGRSSGYQVMPWLTSLVVLIDWSSRSFRASMPTVYVKDLSLSLYLIHETSSILHGERNPKFLVINVEI